MESSSDIAALSSSRHSRSCSVSSGVGGSGSSGCCRRIHYRPRGSGGSHLQSDGLIEHT